MVVEVGGLGSVWGCHQKSHRPGNYLCRYFHQSRRFSHCRGRRVGSEVQYRTCPRREKQTPSTSIGEANRTAFYLPTPSTKPDHLLRLCRASTLL